MKKILSILTLFVLIGTTTMYVNADNQVITTNGVATIDVSANIQSVFEVIVPDSIEITERGVKEFDIVAKGFPRRTETLYLNMSDTMTMTSNGNSVDLDVIIDKDSFYYDDLAIENGTTTKCRIDASALPSGSWVGALEIDIQLKNFELPTNITFRQCTLAYRNNSTGLITIYTFDADKRFVYNQSSNTLGNDCVWGPTYNIYQEQSDGSFVFEREGYTVKEVIALTGNTMIYSNYNIEKDYINSGDIWFSVTEFN